MSPDRAASLHWDDHLGAPLPVRRAEAIAGNRVVTALAERVPSVHALLGQAVAAAGEREAIVDGDTRLSYQELDALVARVATGLAGLGITARDRVVLLCSNRVETVVALFAIQRLSAIAVPVSTREQADGLSFVVGQCGAKAVILDAELRDRVDVWGRAAKAAEPSGRTPFLVRLPALQDDRPAPTAVAAAADPQAVDCDPRDVDADAGWPAGTIEWARLLEADGRVEVAGCDEHDPAVLLYTSGTTGRPKGAMLTHFGIAHSVAHFRACMPLPDGVRMALAVPASHVTGLVAIIAATLHCAGTILIAREFKAASFIEMAARERMQATILVPAMYRLCLMSPAFQAADLSAWEVGGYGGAPMPESTIDELAEQLPALRLVNAYGATETTSPATIMPAELTRANLDSVGLTVPCGDIRIMDDDGREVAPGETGEIWIAGPMVVPGYWENPEATAREFVGGYWKSGDLGSKDAVGFIRVFDRKKDMINRGGYKIYSVEVENRLMAVPGVLEAAVIGRPCPVLGERVHAVLTVERQLPVEELRAACAAVLADYKVPESFEQRAEPLPRNANGKILKRTLRGAS